MIYNEMDNDEPVDETVTLVDEKSGYEVDVHAEYYTDNNYGADADGNRGVSMTFIDEVVYDEFRNGKGKVILESKVPKGILKRLERLVDRYEF